MNGSLIILPQGFEEIEAITTIDLLRRANVKLTIAALDYPMQVTGAHRVEVLAETPLDACVALQYDLVILPGGPGHVNYFNSPVLETFLKSQKGFIAAICAAPLVLHRVGLLKNKRFTCFPADREEIQTQSAAQGLNSQFVDEAVVVDGKIITSAGAGTAFEFGLTLVELLEGKEAAEELAREMIFRK